MRGELKEIIRFYLKFHLCTYICDPDKCPDCGKQACQSLCFRTTDKKQRATGIKWFKYKIAEIRSNYEQSSKT